MPADKLLLFRVHFEDGEKLDVRAKDAATAAKAALARHDGIIRKTKIVREK
ncbi:hypothetical protein [Rhizobium tropici]|uniref:hypothetical protein n=1 Tax=Rhizobium tropici TaxID=398 RepID=UPI0015EC23A4|nr:hypothetical protein [Rhizobium tropici]